MNVEGLGELNFNTSKKIEERSTGKNKKAEINKQPSTDEFVKSEKTDKALDKALGRREQAIKLLEEAGYPSTPENIEEAMKQIKDRE